MTIKNLQINQWNTLVAVDLLHKKLDSYQDNNGHELWKDSLYLRIETYN